MSLAGHVVLITGASSGIGRLMALYAARDGADVVLAARSEAPLASLAREIQALGRTALVLPTDVRDPAAVTALVDATLAHFGRLDTLINNAGYGVFQPWATMDATLAEDMLEVNYLGALRCTLAALPHFRRQGSGHIVTVASVAGLIATQNMGAYSASKFALLGAMEALQIELVGSPIHCSLICPGPIDTPFFTHADYQAMSRFARLMPLLDPDWVARRIIHTVAHPKNLQIWPRAFWALLLLYRAFPGLAKKVVAWVG